MDGSQEEMGIMFTLSLDGKATELGEGLPYSEQSFHQLFLSCRKNLAEWGDCFG